MPDKLQGFTQEEVKRALEAYFAERAKLGYDPVEDELPIDANLTMYVFQTSDDHTEVNLHRVINNRFDYPGLLILRSITVLPPDIQNLGGPDGTL